MENSKFYLYFLHLIKKQLVYNPVISVHNDNLPSKVKQSSV